MEMEKFYVAPEKGFAGSGEGTGIPPIDGETEI